MTEENLLISSEEIEVEKPMSLFVFNLLATVTISSRLPADKVTFERKVSPTVRLTLDNDSVFPP